MVRGEDTALGPGPDPPPPAGSKKRGTTVVGLFRRRLHWIWRLMVGVVTFAVIGGVAAILAASQADARAGVSDRFVARTGLAAKFVGTYVEQLTAREEKVAVETLSDTDVTSEFASDMRSFGFRSGVLLDGVGRVLAIAPANPTALGKPLAVKYAHLARALTGHTAVSDVVRSLADHTPVVAFAVPFSTPTGLRVFSGAYALTDTPLAAFLDDTTNLKGAQLFLVDAPGAVVAASGPAVGAVRSLAQRNPVLARVVQTQNYGAYSMGSAESFFSRATVPGTNWSLIFAATSRSLFVSVSGASQWGPWLILAGLALVAALAGCFAVRLVEGRRSLAAVNSQLESLAQTDGLTGLDNRRHLTEQLEKLLPNIRRHGFPVCVLMIDIDRFKRLNDSFGHQAGDRAIRHVAAQLTDSLRSGDLLARWGGEEFLAVLPNTGMKVALHVAERLRQNVASTPIQLGDSNDLIAIHTSVGVSEATAHDDVDALVNRADHGLYEAKAAGRNAVRSAAATAP